jgi:hypothetical protein
MAIFSIFFLLILAVIPAVICMVWARIDSRRGVFHPVARPCIVAGCLSMVLPFLTMFLLIAESTSGGVQNVMGAWLRVIVVSAFLFVIAATVGLMAYLLAHGGRRKAELIDQNTSPQKVEETGNPYQPSSL